MTSIKGQLITSLLRKRHLFQGKLKKEVFDGGGMVHCYPLMAAMLKEATEAMNEIVRFIKLHLK